jgi:precorrin-3B C17-methyltransferase
MTFKAADVIQNADVVTGYTTYVNMIKPYFPDKTYKATGMMKEVDRCKMAIEDAMAGKDVAMISSGDSGIYGMAGIIYQLADEMKADIEQKVKDAGITKTALTVVGNFLEGDYKLSKLYDKHFTTEFRKAVDE